MLWGGTPEKDTFYLPTTPARNDGNTFYRLTVKDIPVDAFWSVTVYNSEGYLYPNPYNAYALNSLTAKKDPDGAINIQFGGCDGKDPQLPTNHGGMELHRAPVPPASGNPRRYVEISVSTA
jgi:hypothetical protein